jgi:Holliday junction resolvase RusA-like endonuclease
MNLILYGRIPSKKNSTIAFQRNGRIFHFASNEFRRWQKEMTKSIGKTRTNVCGAVTMKFFLPDKRRTDLVNKSESILDFLVDVGILVDDDCVCVPRLLLEYGGIDREKPRVEIAIDC